MSTRTALKAASPWTRLDVTDADWEAADAALLGTMMSQLLVIRAFEEQVL
jgi:2-oxoisovalerate dehydrogenase E1 component